MMAGLLPVIGTALVWVPLSVSAFLQGHPGQGFFLLCWGFLVVGLVDNVLRPYLVGKNSDVSFFMLFISLLGGLQVWGFKGVIIGPLVVAIAPVIFDVYKKRYMHEPEVL
jgi:predicted PurR-regulated permease PerM